MWVASRSSGPSRGLFHLLLFQQINNFFYLFLFFLMEQMLVSAWTSSRFSRQLQYIGRMSYIARLQVAEIFLVATQSGLK